MCGIAGIVSERLAAQGAAETVVRSMLRIMRHRGPDATGVRASGSAVIGADRLAIVDLRPLEQPVLSWDRRYAIAYNGEVYNHSHLRRELAESGARFRTTTDTEVVLESFRAWGPRCLERFVGMFAFVILDTDTGSLFGGRDRLGKKPLLYCHDDDLFAFASFLPAFEAVPGLDTSHDPEALLEVLQLGWVQGPRTALSRVRQIPPGHAFSLSEGGALETWRWWALKDAFLAGCGRGPREVEDDVEALEPLLEQAVADRLVADVPVGAFLSGGLDSSIIAALATELSPERLRTFTVAFDVPGFDESRHAARVARRLGTEHHVSTLALDDPRRLEVAQWYVGEPLADNSVLPTWLVSGEARAHVKVALSGDGADELFAGYETFRADRVHGLLSRLPAWPLRPMLRKAVDLFPVRHGKLPFAERARRFVGGLDLPPADAHLHWRALQSHGDALACLLPEARRGLEAADPSERARLLDAEVAGCDRVNRASYVDTMTYLPDDILVKVDRASMAHGLEARCPFLDHRFVETAARLPGHLKLRFMTTKWILRRQHARRLPATTLLRPKRGFSSPVARWLLGPLRETFHDLVTPARMAPLGLDAAEAHRRLDDLRHGRAYHGYALWAVLVVAAWDAQRRRSEPPA